MSTDHWIIAPAYGGAISGGLANVLSAAGTAAEYELTAGTNTHKLRFIGTGLSVGIPSALPGGISFSTKSFPAIAGKFVAGVDLPADIQLRRLTSPGMIFELGGVVAGGGGAQILAFGTPAMPIIEPASAITAILPILIGIGLHLGFEKMWLRPANIAGYAVVAGSAAGLDLPDVRAYSGHWICS